MSLKQKSLTGATVGAAVDTTDVGDGLPFTTRVTNGGSIVYSDLWTGPNGSRSVKFTPVASAGCETRRTLLTPSASLAHSFCIAIPTSLPPVGSTLHRVAAAGGTVMALQVSGTGKLQIYDNAGVRWTSAAALPVDTVLRITYGVVCSATAGTIVLSIYNATSGALIDTASLSSLNTLNDSITYMAWGHITGNAYTGSLYYSNIQWREGTAVLIPPYVQAAAAADKATARVILPGAVGWTPVGAATGDAALAGNPNAFGVIDANRGIECTPDATGKTVTVELNALTAAPDRYSSWVKGTGTVDIELLQGETSIASKTGTAVSTSSGVEIVDLLTVGEIAAISDPTALRVKTTIKSA